MWLVELNRMSEMRYRGERMSPVVVVVVDV